MNLLDGEGKATIGLVYLIGSLWVLNGYVHGMAYPPIAAMMAHWFKPSELATKQSIGMPRILSVRALSLPYAAGYCPVSGTAPGTCVLSFRQSLHFWAPS